MGLNFDFAFLGRYHQYAASVTQVSSGYAIAPADTACFRLPESWTKPYEDSTLSRYISDIRGHDFLSYTGRWSSESRKCGFSEKSKNIIEELGGLRALGKELEGNKCHRADFKLTLGPESGSYFADVKKIKRYRSDKLPRNLKNAIWDEVTERGYGKIAGVAMNSTGGWVIHYCAQKAFGFKKRKHQFDWGGVLPQALEAALAQGRDRRANISHMFLNHQHADEFLLIFKDGFVHVNLHYDFQKKIRRLVNMWVTNTLKQPVNWESTSYSCQCEASDQEQRDASYYNRRALFFIFLSKPPYDQASSHHIDLALAYLGEAFQLDSKSEETQHIERMALVAARRIKNDQILEQKIASAVGYRVTQTAYIDLRDSTPAGQFRNQYLSLIKSEEDFVRLVVQVDQLELPTEWSCSMASCDATLAPIQIEENGYNQSPASIAPVEMMGSIHL